MALGSATTTVATSPRPFARSQSGHSNWGASAIISARSIGLYIWPMSRCRSGAHCTLAELGFELDDPVRLRRRVGDAGERLDPDHVIAIGAADRVELLARFEVVIAIGQPQARLPGKGDIAGRVFRIGDNAELDGHRVTRFGQQSQVVGTGPDRFHFGQIGRERGQSARLDAGLVHPRRVEVADLPALPRRRRRIARHVLRDLADLAFHFVGHQFADAGAGAVGRDLGPLVPAAVGISPRSRRPDSPSRRGR
jgi:hypothetical protein